MRLLIIVCLLVAAVSPVARSEDQGPRATAWSDLVFTELEAEERVVFLGLAEKIQQESLSSEWERIHRAFVLMDDVLDVGRREDLSDQPGWPEEQARQLDVLKDHSGRSWDFWADIAQTARIHQELNLTPEFEAARLYQEIERALALFLELSAPSQ